MGTRSLVAVQQGTTYRSVYCHYDGYLSYTGQILLDHWPAAAVETLLTRGDNSGIKPTIEEMNFYEVRAGQGEAVTEFVNSTPWQVAHSFAQLIQQVQGCGAEYYYVLRDDQWFAGCVYDTEGLTAGALVDLRTAMETLEVDG